MAQTQLQCNAAAKAVAVHVRSIDSEMVQERGDVVGEHLVREGTADVGGMPMTLELDRNHSVTRRERPHQTSHQPHGHVRARQYDQGLADTVSLVIHLEPVDMRVTGTVRHQHYRNVGYHPTQVDGLTEVEQRAGGYGKELVRGLRVSRGTRCRGTVGK